jgi:hypothetical protein
VVSTIFANIFWPTIALALLLFRLLMRLRAPTRYSTSAWCLVLALLFLPPFALLYVFFNGSALMMLDQDTMFAALGVLLLFYLNNLASTRRTAWLLLGFGILGIGVGGWNLVGDFVLPRHQAEGVVERKAVDRTGGLAPFYQVTISGRPLNVTADLFGSLAVGAHVRVVFGIATGTIFRVERLT